MADNEVIRLSLLEQPLVGLGIGEVPWLEIARDWLVLSLASFNIAR